ncbi:HBS1-like protein [Clydaea vesicula]|uniref:Elongation factor 1 alpha-like protein n=1 Tax=Clydaea vesicula TaxID=447962 RepID=A0AAD5U712_9FUNG|nr:HBS1-like protein [Clydaea vesicula]
MSRHRNVRNMIEDDFYDDYDDNSDFGTSYEEYGASFEGHEYLYNRNQSDIQHNSAEEKDYDDNPEGSEILSKVREITGNQFSDQEIKSALCKFDYDINKTVDHCDAEEKQNRGPTSTNDVQISNFNEQKKPKVKKKPVSGAINSTILPKSNAEIDMESLGFSLEKEGILATKILPQPQSMKKSSSLSSLLQQKDNLSSAPTMERSLSKNGSRTGINNSLTSLQQSSSSPKPFKKLINVEKELEVLKKSGVKASLNLVVVGHVDAVFSHIFAKGKSTTMGHLLYLLGEVNERVLKKYEKEAEKMKKGSFSFAWVLDSTQEERERGVTIDVAINTFQTKNLKFTLLDAPGHKDFIPNMISGAAQADCAILVVDSSTGEFESGFELGGQTREHALLLRSLGVVQIIVAVNKLDMMDWSQNRFEHIKTKLLQFLVSTGFHKSKINFVPISGYQGENLVKLSNPLLKSWYKGLTLCDQIDKFTVPERAIKKSFRMSVTDFFKGGLGVGGSGSVSVRGRIEAGTIQIGERVLVRPVNVYGIVKGIEVGDDNPKWAVAGDSITMSLTNCDETHFTTGSVLCDPATPIPVTSYFRAQIVTFDLTRPLIGDDLILIQGSLKEECRISKLVSILNKSTGEVIKQNPRFLQKHQTAVVEIKVINKAICLDVFKESKELGRIMLRLGCNSVAAGIILDILEFQKGGEPETA